MGRRNEPRTLWPTSLADWLVLLMLAALLVVFLFAVAPIPFAFVAVTVILICFLAGMSWGRMKRRPMIGQAIGIEEIRQGAETTDKEDGVHVPFHD